MATDADGLLVINLGTDMVGNGSFVLVDPRDGNASEPIVQFEQKTIEDVAVDGTGLVVSDHGTSGIILTDEFGAQPGPPMPLGRFNPAGDLVVSRTDAHDVVSTDGSWVFSFSSLGIPDLDVHDWVSDRSLLVSADDAVFIVTVDPENPGRHEVSETIPDLEEPGINGILVDRTGRRLLEATAGEIIVWDLDVDRVAVTNPRVAASYPSGHVPLGAVGDWSPDSNRFMVVDAQSTLQICVVASAIGCEPVTGIEAPEHPNWQLMVGPWLLAGTSAAVNVWDPDGGVPGVHSWYSYVIDLEAGTASRYRPDVCLDSFECVISGSVSREVGAVAEAKPVSCPALVLPEVPELALEVKGGVDCAEAEAVMTTYITDDELERSGSGGFAYFDGWECSSDFEFVHCTRVEGRYATVKAS